MTALSGARVGGANWLRRLVARAAARDLTVFVVPGLEIARAHGLDVGAAGLRPVATPRHAAVLLVVGELPDGLRCAAAVVWAQMPRPRAILTLGAGAIDPLPGPDLEASLEQAALVGAVTELRRSFVIGAFSPSVVDFDVAAVRTETTYTCPMHPEIMRAEQGQCPICGMDLVPREQAGGDEQAGEGMNHGDDEHGEQGMEPQDARQEGAEDDVQGYTCPMHPEVTRDEPGACPICGMDLVPHASDSEEAGGATETGTGDYTCPMHPEIGQDTPGSCPICGMALIPRAEVSPKHDAGRDARGDHEDHDQTAGQHAGHEMPGNHPAEQHDANAEGAGRDAMDQQGGMGDGGHGMQGMDHGGEQGEHDMGGMDHGGEQGGQDMDMGDGFMSMVMMTQDLPRSADGLPMEWLEVPFGPLAPGLPGGLDLTLTLDGDTVVVTRIKRGATTRGLDTTWPGPVATLPDRLARLDPLVPFAYRLLAQRAVEAISGVVPDEATQRARIGAAERERAASHLNWLVAFLGLLGQPALAEEAVRLHRVLLGATDIALIARHRPAVAAFARRVQRRPLLARRLRGIGALGAAAAPPWTGPVARGAGATEDARAADQRYRALGFAPVVRAGADAWARLEVRLAELIQSLDLILAAGAFTPASWVVPSGAGAGRAHIETPRGTATLWLAIRDGAIREVELVAPSMSHLAFVKAVTEGREVTDALVGVASLDLSPWELGR